MNEWGHKLSAFSAVMHLIIGVPEVFGWGIPRFLPPSWRLLFGLLPDPLDWLYPGLFVLTGLVAAWGVRCPRALRVGFLLSAVCFSLWGVAGLYGWHTDQGGNIPGSAANLLLAGYALILARYVTVSAKVEAQVERLGQKVETVERERARVA